MPEPCDGGLTCLEDSVNEMSRMDSGCGLKILDPTCPASMPSLAADHSMHRHRALAQLAKLPRPSSGVALAWTLKTHKNPRPLSFAFPLLALTFLDLAKRTFDEMPPIGTYLRATAGRMDRVDSAIHRPSALYQPSSSSSSLTMSGWMADP